MRGRARSSLINSGDSAVTIDPPTLPQAPEMIVRFDQKGPMTLKPGEKVKVIAYAKPIKSGLSMSDVTFHTSSTINPEVVVRLSCKAGS